MSSLAHHQVAAACYPTAIQAARSDNVINITRPQHSHTNKTMLLRVHRSMIQAQAGGRESLKHTLHHHTWPRTDAFLPAHCTKRSLRAYTIKDWITTVISYVHGTHRQLRTECGYVSFCSSILSPARLFCLQRAATGCSRNETDKRPLSAPTCCLLCRGAAEDPCTPPTPLLAHPLARLHAHSNSTRPPTSPSYRLLAVCRSSAPVSLLLTCPPPAQVHNHQNAHHSDPGYQMYDFCLRVHHVVKHNSRRQARTASSPPPAPSAACSTTPTHFFSHSGCANTNVCPIAWPTGG